MGEDSITVTAVLDLPKSSHNCQPQPLDIRRSNISLVVGNCPSSYYKSVEIAHWNCDRFYQLPRLMATLSVFPKMNNKFRYSHRKPDWAFLELGDDVQSVLFFDPSLAPKHFQTSDYSSQSSSEQASKRQKIPHQSCISKGCCTFASLHTLVGHAVLTPWGIRFRSIQSKMDYEIVLLCS